MIINGKTYPNSVTFSCNGPLGDSAPLAYSVSGTEFTAVIGYGPGPGNGDQNEVTTVTIPGPSFPQRGFPARIHLPPPRITLADAST